MIEVEASDEARASVMVRGGRKGGGEKGDGGSVSGSLCVCSICSGVLVRDS